ncbi:MAG: hypothetical protein ABFD25_00840 [Clostridiaceae bacterium]
MGLVEKDPREISYVALYVAIKWYTELSSDAALRIAQGNSHAKPGNKLTPEIFAEIKRIIDSPNFHTINGIVKKYRINKYDIFEALEGEKNVNEEVLIVTQTERLLKRLKELAENCTAVDCEKCPLDKLMCGEYTLCEMLADTALDGQGKMKFTNVRQVPDKCPTVDDLAGDVIKKTYRLYKQADDEIHKYVEKHPREKQQDIISLALLEYVSKKNKPD